MVSSTPRPQFTHEKDPVPILQEAGWAPGPVWTGGKSRPHRDSIPDRPARSQSLYRLSYSAHSYNLVPKDNEEQGGCTFRSSIRLVWRSVFLSTVTVLLVFTFLKIVNLSHNLSFAACSERVSARMFCPFVLWRVFLATVAHLGHFFCCLHTLFAAGTYRASDVLVINICE